MLGFWIAFGCAFILARAPGPVLGVVWIVILLLAALVLFGAVVDKLAPKPKMLILPPRDPNRSRFPGLDRRRTMDPAGPA